MQRRAEFSSPVRVILGALSGYGGFLFGELAMGMARGAMPVLRRAAGQVGDAVGRGAGDAGGGLGRRIGRSADDAGEGAGRRLRRNTDDVCHANSFSADTTVATPDGDIPISELEIGDAVLAYDETTGEVGAYTITDTISHIDPVIVHLTIDGEVIETTPDHPFYTIDGEWVAAGYLDTDDLILSLDGGTGAVESVAWIADAQAMYNLTVEVVHTFAVGDGAWVVHNVCPEYGLSNLDDDVAKNVEFNRKSLDSIEPRDGAGWTGAYDMQTNKFVALPSDPMSTRLRATGAPPPGILGRNGGHGPVAGILQQELNVDLSQRETRFVGFALSYPSSNELQAGWISNTLNLNPLSQYTSSRLVLVEYQAKILESIREVLPQGVVLSNPKPHGY